MKKDENRFTIRFNTVDPRQRITRDALEAAGRRKALLITDAICEYLARHGGDGAVVNIPLVPYLPVVVNANSAVPLASDDAVNVSNFDNTHNTYNASGSPNSPDKEESNVQNSSVPYGGIGDNDISNADTSDTDYTLDALSIDNDMREAILGGLSAFKI